MSPMFSAVSSSARQLYLLLRCISFGPKTTVQITSDGLRFSIEDGRIMQGLAFLDKSLFTSYHYAGPTEPTSHDPLTNSALEPDDTAEEALTFQISLAALLETLQIFGAGDTSRPERPVLGGSGGQASFQRANDAFAPESLGLSSLCRLHYEAPGHPLRITIAEGNMTTTCSLTTYEPEALDYGDEADIPFDRENLQLKIILRSALLHDAVAELSFTSPAQVVLCANPDAAPHLSLSAEGPLCSVKVDYDKDHPQLLETFQTNGEPARQVYGFAQLKGTLKAMAQAAKCSIRVDGNGVLSLQFMIEIDEGSKQAKNVSFVEFRLVPLADDEEGGEQSGQEDETGRNNEV